MIAETRVQTGSPSNNGDWHEHRDQEPRAADFEHDSTPDDVELTGEPDQILVSWPFILSDMRAGLRLLGGHEGTVLSAAMDDDTWWFEVLLTSSDEPLPAPEPRHINISQLARETGSNRPRLQDAKRRLIRKGILIELGDGRVVPNMDIRTWDPGIFRGNQALLNWCCDKHGPLNTRRRLFNKGFWPSHERSSEHENPPEGNGWNRATAQFAAIRNRIAATLAETWNRAMARAGTERNREVDQLAGERNSTVGLAAAERNRGVGLQAAAGACDSSADQRDSTADGSQETTAAGSRQAAAVTTLVAGPADQSPQQSVFVTCAGIGLGQSF